MKKLEFPCYIIEVYDDENERYWSLSSHTKLFYANDIIHFEALGEEKDHSLPILIKGKGRYHREIAKCHNMLEYESWYIDGFVTTIDRICGSLYSNINETKLQNISDDNILYAEVKFKGSSSNPFYFKTALKDLEQGQMVLIESGALDNVAEFIRYIDNPPAYVRRSIVRVLEQDRQFQEGRWHNISIKVETDLIINDIRRQVEELHREKCVDYLLEKKDFTKLKDMLDREKKGIFVWREIAF